MSKNICSDAEYKRMTETSVSHMKQLQKPRGIIVCGLNGAGKSTLGPLLAERLSCRFIDIEDLYFPKTDEIYLFSSPRSDGEVTERLWDIVSDGEPFVLAAVRGAFGEQIEAAFSCALYLDVPRETRLKRVFERSHAKFGDRMLEGGDLYDAETAFFEHAAKRDETYVTKWLEALRLPVIRLDGTLPPEENVNKFLE